jgi:hypothetical protein
MDIPRQQLQQASAASASSEDQFEDEDNFVQEEDGLSE